MTFMDRMKQYLQPGAHQANPKKDAKAKAEYDDMEDQIKAAEKDAAKSKEELSVVKAKAANWKRRYL